MSGGLYTRDVFRSSYHPLPRRRFVSSRVGGIQPLQASVLGTGTVTGHLSENQLRLAASVLGTSSVTATLRLRLRLAAVVNGTSTVLAAIRLNKLRLAAVVNGTSTVTANLTVAGGAIVRRLRMLRGLGE